MGAMHHVRGRLFIYTLYYTNFVGMLPTTGAVAYEDCAITLSAADADYRRRPFLTSGHVGP